MKDQNPADELAELIYLFAVGRLERNPTKNVAVCGWERRAGAGMPLGDFRFISGSREHLSGQAGDLLVTWLRWRADFSMSTTAIQR